jgi:hypothetical protein
MTPAGFSHSEIFGSTPACDSPKLFAANHVLHRFLAPRHPPCALSSLTTNFLRIPTEPMPLLAKLHSMRMSLEAGWSLISKTRGSSRARLDESAVASSPVRYATFNSRFAVYRSRNRSSINEPRSSLQSDARFTQDTLSRRRCLFCFQ